MPGRVTSSGFLSGALCMAPVARVAFVVRTGFEPVSLLSESQACCRGYTDQVELWRVYHPTLKVVQGPPAHGPSLSQKALA